MTAGANAAACHLGAMTEMGCVSDRALQRLETWLSIPPGVALAMTCVMFKGGYSVSFFSTSGLGDT